MLTNNQSGNDGERDNDVEPVEHPGEDRTNQTIRAPPASVQSVPSTSSTLVPSRFFAQTAATQDDNSPTQTLHRVLSPVGAARNQPIDITDTSSDSLPPPSTFSLPPSSTPSRTAKVSSNKRDEFDLSSDFIDDAFLDELDKVEQAAVASDFPSSRHQDPRVEERTKEEDVIVIDDDDDIESSKENVPVLKAVTGRGRSQSLDVIDLSD